MSTPCSDNRSLGVAFFSVAAGASATATAGASTRSSSGSTERALTDRRKPLAAAAAVAAAAASEASRPFCSCPSERAPSASSAWSFSRSASCCSVTLATRWSISSLDAAQHLYSTPSYCSRSTSGFSKASSPPPPGPLRLPLRNDLLRGEVIADARRGNSEIVRRGVGGSTEACDGVATRDESWKISFTAGRPPKREGWQMSSTSEKRYHL